MARARNIKPQLFDNEVLAELDPFARLLFIGLWCWADREGRLEDRPKRIHKEILGYDSCDCDELLNQLNESGFIVRYQVEGVKYIQVVKFSKHQNPHHQEKESIIPEFILDKTEITPIQDEIITEPIVLIPDSLNLIPDSLIRVDDNREPEITAKEEPPQEPPPKNKKLIKHKYGEYEKVYLDDNQLEKLKTEFPANWETWIQRLDDYVASTGKVYKDHLATIRNWAKRDKQSKSKSVMPEMSPERQKAYEEMEVDHAVDLWPDLEAE